MSALLLAALMAVLAAPQDPFRAGRAPRRAGGAGEGRATEQAHHGERLVCSDCHTVHNSRGGQPMRFDGVSMPAPVLLREANPTQLCLACHSGSYPLIPDVLGPVSYTADPAGGWFAQGLGLPNAHGHDLSPPSALAAPGSTESFTIECASCHDVHGSSNYRNLLLDPPGSADDGDVRVVVDQIIAPNGANAAQVYTPANLLDRSGMGEFCNSCHDNFHGRSASEEGAQRPWLRHPQEVAIAGAPHADFGHWSGPIVNRVRVETPTDDLVPSVDDRVSCLSCHKAHGSSRPDSLIYADGLRRRSTCQQCHDQ
ncbi:MAG: hypothetical protein H8E31_10555 [Planctomycetes bacterium]|nr:hypothetical protein [Planctomycetota bacterium]